MGKLIDRFASFLLENATDKDAVEFLKKEGVKETNIYLFERLRIDDVRYIKSKSEVIHTEKMGFIFGQIGFDAQNALLKLIEEPPPETVFVFYKPDILLDTIRSRCQIIRRRKEFELNDGIADAIARKDFPFLLGTLLSFEKKEKNDIMALLEGVLFRLSEKGEFKKAEKVAGLIKDYKEFNLNKRLLLMNLFLALRGENESSYC